MCSVTHATCCLQVCIFLKLDVPELQDALYLCALRCTLTGEGRYTHQPELQRKRPRSTPPEIAEVQAGAAQVLDWVERKPDIAEAVLTAPRARERSTPLALGDLYAALPDKLCAAAARGFFGSAGAEWRLNAADAPASTRTLQLLLRQPSVTAVRLLGSEVQAQLHALVGGIAMATQLTAISIEDNTYHDAAESSRSAATSWLHQLASLTGLQRLEMRGCRLPRQSLLAADATLVHLQRLTALVLQGVSGQGGKADGAVAKLAPALLALTELSELGLRGVFMGRAGMRAVGGVLGSLSRLCTLDLSCAVSVGKHVNMTGVPLAACTALTKLDLTRCSLSAGCNSVRELRGMQARLLSLTLEGNCSLGTSGVCDILSVPSLLGLTRLSLASVGMQLGGVWPWRQLCALTMLRDLRLSRNRLEDAGASALAPCVPALVQLRCFGISDCGLTVAGALARALWRLPLLQQLACEQAMPMVEPFEVPADARARGLELVSRIKWR